MICPSLNVGSFVTEGLAGSWLMAGASTWTSFRFSWLAMVRTRVKSSLSASGACVSEAGTGWVVLAVAVATRKKAADNPAICFSQRHQQQRKTSRLPRKIWPNAALPEPPFWKYPTTNPPHRKSVLFEFFFTSRPSTFSIGSCKWTTLFIFSGSNNIVFHWYLETKFLIRRHELNGFNVVQSIPFW